MDKNTLNIRLNLNNREVYHCRPVKQLDKLTRFLRVEVYDRETRYTIAPGTVANINIRKPDGFYIYNVCTVSDNAVIAPLTQQALAAPGTLVGDIELKQNGERLSTQRFEIEVVKTEYNEASIVSSNEYGGLQADITAAQAARAGAEAAKAGAETAKAGSEAAKTAAETAKAGTAADKTATEAAKAAAEAARLGAVNEKNAAQAAKTATESARDTAITAKNTAVSAKDTAVAAAQTAQPWYPNVSADGVLSFSINNTLTPPTAVNIRGKTFLGGKMVYPDPTFRYGNNSITIYNNNPSLPYLTLTRIDKPEECPTTSTHCLEVKATQQVAPGYGGFKFATQARPNAVFIGRVLAKIPKGCVLNYAQNSTGTPTERFWLTSAVGTGKYEEYMYCVKCGDTAPFMTAMFFYIDNLPSDLVVTPQNPLIWHIAFATVYDLTDGEEPLNATTLRDTLKQVDGAGSGIDADLLDGKESSAFALSDHTHSGYAATSHVHSADNITGLQALLDSKSPTSHTHAGYAETNHTHAETQITSGFLQTLSQNGYRKLPGGVMLAWGVQSSNTMTYQAGQGARVKAIVFPVAYTVAPSVTTGVNYAAGLPRVGTSSVTRTGFNLMCENVADVNVMWIAIGY